MLILISHDLGGYIFALSKASINTVFLLTLLYTITKTKIFEIKRYATEARLYLYLYEHDRNTAR